MQTYIIGGNTKSISGAENAAAMRDLFAPGQMADRLTLVTAYKRVGFFRRCVNYRAGAISSIPFTIHREGSADPIYDSSESDEWPEEIAWLRPLRKLLWKTEASLLLDEEGKAAWLKLGRPPRRVDGLQFWAIGNWSIWYDQTTGAITHYTHNMRLGEQIRPEWVVAFYQDDPTAEIGPGSGSGAAARVNADVLHSLNTFLDSYLDNGLIKGTIIAMKGATKEQRDEADTFWNRWFKGKKNAGRVKAVNAEAMDVQTVGEGLKDMANVNLSQDQQEQLASAMSIPHALLMSNKTGAKATTEEDHVYFTEYTMVPQAIFIEDVINDQLLNPLGLRLKFQFDRLHVRRSKVLTLAGVAQAASGKPPLTVDEVREIMGKKPLTPEQRDEIMPPPPEPLDPEQQSEREEEVKKWRRKASRKGRDAQFEATHLSPQEQAVIKARLATDMNLDEVFAPPYVGF